MSKLLLVDCDGTIRETISGKTFIEDPHDQKVIEGADVAINWYRRKGWDIVGISNQGGVAAGYKSLDDADVEQRITLDLFPQIRAIFMCPDFKGEECFWIQRDRPRVEADTDIDGNLNDLAGLFRKPNGGMLIAAIRLFGYSKHTKDYWYVGDREEDSLAAAAAGVNFCDAEKWRNRFKPGMHELDATPELMEFLEGIKLQP